MSRRQRKEVRAATLLERARLENVRSTVGEVRDGERESLVDLAQPGADIYNPNIPTGEGFDRTQPQARDAKVEALGFRPNSPRAYLDIQSGDAGNGPTNFRRVQIYHLLGNPLPDRTAEIPYSESIPLYTYRSSDQRPRYLHCSLFATGWPANAAAPTPPIDAGDIETLAAGIPSGTSFATAESYPDVPLIPTVKFRVLVQDESGGRFFDVDVMGARGFNVYAFAVTVFVLVKPGGYQVDPVVDVNNQQALGPGVVENAIVGARILPLFQNDTQNRELRTEWLAHPGDGAVRNVQIPPGATRVQVMTTAALGVIPLYFLDFVTGSPFTGVDLSNTSMGAIDFRAATHLTQIYDIPNSNLIRVRAADGVVEADFSFVFEVGVE